jgi:hypothetical protein
MTFERYEYPKYPLYKEIDGIETLITVFNNDMEVNLFRIKCVKEGLSGYYFKYGGEVIFVDEYGDFTNFPKGWLDQSMQVLLTLTKLRREKQ